jgi:hypothetical protein
MQAGAYDPYSVVGVLGQVVSFLFHPLFLTSYVAGFIIFIHPSEFAGVPQREKIFRLISVFFISCFLPLFSILLCKPLGFIQSLYLRSSRERIIPYALVMFFYWWLWYVFHNLPNIAPALVKFLLGCFLAICGGWMGNIYFKISMHALGAGGLLMFAILFSLNEPYASGTYLSIAVLVSGLVCTSRFIVSDHSAREIYSGFLLGLLAQWVAWQLGGG